MLKIDFTPEEIARLDYERYHHPHPRVQRKIEVLYLILLCQIKYLRQIMWASIMSCIDF
jgi:hypothetical protein